MQIAIAIAIHFCFFITLSRLTSGLRAQAGRSSSISVTSAAIGERSDLVKVT
jgi:hypothetical protein